MNYIVVQNNKFIKYRLFESKNNGYKFYPKKNINNLIIVNQSLIKTILEIRIRRDILKATKTINLMLGSSITLISDCDMMEKELFRLLKKIDNKYKKYFNEFEYFELIKDIYSLNMEILLKKKFLVSD